MRIPFSLLGSMVIALLPIIVNNYIEKPASLIWQGPSPEISSGNEKTVIVKRGIPLSLQLVDSNTVYVFRKKYDLQGEIVRIPSGCTLDFRCGSRVYNGCFKGEINVTGKYERALHVICQGDILTKNFRVYHVSPEVDRSKIESCVNGCVICEDLLFPKSKGDLVTCLSIKSDLRGEKRSIVLRVDSSYRIALTLEKDGICVSDITIRKDIPDKWNYRYAITSSKGNLTIRQCNIFGALSFGSRSEDSISSGIVLEDNTVISDFTAINWKENPYDLEKDAITFKSVDDVIIQRNSFEFINVNRGFKLTANYRKENNKTQYFHYPKNIYIVNNTIKAYTTGQNKSKQLIDCYIGAQNVEVKDNNMDVSGFSVVFENKTQAPVHNDISSNVISGNHIKCDCRLCYIRTTDKDNFVITGNEIYVSDPTYPFTENGNDFFNGNAFCSCPGFSNMRIDNNKVHYIGDKARLYFLVVSSSNRNADLIVSGNEIDAMTSTIVSGVNRFTYIDNSTRIRDHQYELEVQDIGEIVVEKQGFDKETWPRHLIHFRKGNPSRTLLLSLPKDIESNYEVIVNPSYVGSINSNVELEESGKNTRRVKRK